jgi:hypothetical protein
MVVTDEVVPSRIWVTQGFFSQSGVSVLSGFELVIAGIHYFTGRVVHISIWR